MPRTRLEMDEHWMGLALEVAREAGVAGEVPVGALLVRDGLELVRAGNRTVTEQDATSHAETLAIRRGCATLGSWRLDKCTLYVTLEPCAMCAGAIVLSRLARVVFGAWDDKTGMVGSVNDLLRHPRLNHQPEVKGGVLAGACGELLRDFFAAKRDGPAFDSRDAAG